MLVDFSIGMSIIILSNHTVSKKIISQLNLNLLDLEMNHEIQKMPP
jgi:hypothetical protein